MDSADFTPARDAQEPGARDAHRSGARDAQRTRADILAAAIEAFSTRGYAATGVREITAAAGVNPALVSRYFGSKEKLYEQALASLLDAALITGIARDRFGEAIVAMLFASDSARPNPLPMMMLASADPGARAITQDLLRRLVIDPLARWFGAPDGERRAVRFVLLASGLTVYRQIYPLPPLVDGDDAMRRWLVDSFQSVVA